MTPHRAAAVASLLLALCWAAPLRAERGREPGAAELLEAVEQIREGRCDAAIPLLRRAHELGGLRNALWNLAECYATLGRPTLAIEAYRGYAAHPRTGAEDRAEAEAAIARLEASLARVDLGSTVEGARVLVDGQEVGTAPLVLPLGAGPHVLVVTSPGFSEWSRVLELGPGETLALEAELTVLPGRLALASRPPGASVRIDGDEVGATPWEDDLPGGAHVVELRLPGYRPLERRVATAAGQRSALTLELEPAGGTLTVGVNASDAELEIGGEPRGTSPFAPMRLPPGEHSLSVTAPGHRPWAGSVEVVDGMTSAVEVDLFALRGLHQGWFWGLLATTVASLGASIGLFVHAAEGVASYNDIATRMAVGALADQRPNELRATALATREQFLPFQDAANWLLVAAGASSLATLVVGVLTRFREAPSSAETRMTDEPLVDETGELP